jgi:hypothetical protein
VALARGEEETVTLACREEETMTLARGEEEVGSFRGGWGARATRTGAKSLALRIPQ